MNIRFITLGHALAQQEKAWIDTYIKRLGAFTTVTHSPIKDKYDLYQNRDDPKYAAWVNSLLDPKHYTIVLDEEGHSFSTDQLHQKIFDIELAHKNITFIIGGAYGLPASTIKNARLSLSLGKLTLPHRLAFLVLVEQVYRCFTIEKNIPYHHL